MLEVAGSLALGAVWWMFFRKIDSFEKEPVGRSLLFILLGGLSPFLIQPIIGLSPFLKNLSEDSTGTDLFEFALFRVAMVEELVKLLPLLIVLRFPNWVNESVDYIKYPALTAIGFATVENILYAHRHGIDVLQIRGLLCVSGHIFYSATSGYFFWLGKRSKGISLLVLPLFGFAFGAFCHGTYDYLLFETSLPMLAWLSIALCVGFMWLFKKMILHTLAQSEFFREHILDEIFDSGWVLFKGLIGIFVFIILGLLATKGLEPALNYAAGNIFQGIGGSLLLTFLLAIDTKDRKVLLRRFF
jgi:RsiW-degrading membrane proteinase PrsW (M82 family)